MGRSKQNKGGTSKDGKYRKETKEERRARLQSQEEAREQCLKYIPMVAGGVLVFLIAFAVYVRSVPPYKPPAATLEQLANLQKPQFQGGVPEFMHVDTGPMVKEALEEASQVLKDMEDKEGDEGSKGPTDETIEL